MAVNSKTVAEKIFNVLKGYGFDVKTFNDEGKLVIDPMEGSRFAVDNPNILVRLDNSKNELQLSTSEDLSDHNIRGMLKELAQDYLIDFDFKVFDKKIKPKGEQIDVSRKAERDMADVMEASLGRMTGSSKTSYQPLENVKIVVRHKKPVNEEIRGARSRNIHSIFIQRGDERFKMAENNLQAARAMARHMYNGGEMYDSTGATIIKMAEDYKQLREFVRYVKNAKLVNESNQEFVELAIENINNIRTAFKRLHGAKSYATAVESINNFNTTEILEDDLDLESKFTETHFDDKVANVMDNLKHLAGKRKAFENNIMSAIENETFENLKEMLEEADVVNFDTPEAKLGHQVSQLGHSSKDENLSNYLHDLSSKIQSGAPMSQFEYGAIKSCLLSANTTESKSKPIDEADSYEAFLNQFSD